MLQQKKYIYLFLITLFGTVLRLLPTLLTAMPYSPDAWPLIKDVEILLEHTPVPLTSDVFSGSKHYWPSIILFGSIVHHVTGLSPIQAMALFVPLASSLLIPIFYALIDKLLGNTKIALVGALLIATLFPFAMFTAEVKREVYATPLYLFLIFLFIGNLERRRIALFSVVALVLVLAHPLPPLVLTALFGSTALSKIVGKQMWMKAAPFFILFALYLLHFHLYVPQVYSFVLSYEIFIVAGFFGSLLLFLGLYTIHTPRLTKKNIIVPLLAVGGLFLFSLNFSETLAPTSLVLPLRYLLYFGGPLFIGAPIVSIGYARLIERKKRELSLFWLLVVSGFELFALFGINSFIIFYRSINFLIPPLTILLAGSLYKKVDISGKGLKQTVMGIGLTALVIFSLFNLYASFSMEERYMGYQLKQKPCEYNAGRWISQHRKGDGRVLADTKMRFLLMGYFGIRVNNWDVDEFLRGEEDQPLVFLTYRQMRKNGILRGPYPQNLPEGWQGRVEKMDCVYSNGNARVYVRSEIG